MTTYSVIGDAELLVDKPITESLLSRLRDNPIAITEGSAGAPRVQSQGMQDVGISHDYLVGEPAGGTHTGSSWTKIGEFYVTREGYYATRVDCARLGGTSSGSVRVYKNGVGYADTNPLPNSDQLYGFTDTLSFVDGDLLQVYAQVSGGDLWWKISVMGFSTDCFTSQNRSFALYPGPLG